MTNRPKAKGTAFETAVLRYVSAETGQEPYRTALHGNADQGDLHGLTAGRLKVTLECKAYKTYCHADVERWRAETLAERRNAGADVALLVIKQPNVGEKTFWRNRCDVWMPDTCACSTPTPCRTASAACGRRSTSARPWTS